MENRGMVTMQSPYSAHDTISRIEQVLLNNGVTIFAKVDHTENALTVGLTLRPTVVLLFGAPHIGTLLMQENQQIGIDLPSKVLVWEDEKGDVWLTWNQASWLAERHDLGGNPAISTLEDKIGKFLRQAIV